MMPISLTDVQNSFCAMRSCQPAAGNMRTATIAGQMHIPWCAKRTLLKGRWDTEIQFMWTAIEQVRSVRKSVMRVHCELPGNSFERAIDDTAPTTAIDQRTVDQSAQ
jgi:hypothetical protein